MRFNRLASTTAIVAVAATMVACEGGTARGFLTTGPTTGVRVRLINALTLSSALDFVVDGQVAATGIGFGAASPYVSLPLASHQLQARNATGTTLLDFTRDLSTEGAFSLIPAPGLSPLGALLLSDNTTQVSGQARIRVVNVAAAPGPVAIYLTGATGDITAISPSIATLLFGTASDYLQVAPGSYRVRVTRAGNPGDVLVDLATLTVGAGAVRTLLVTDAPSGGLPTSLSVITD